MKRTLLGWKVFQSQINVTASVKKYSLEKHVEGDPDLYAVDLEKQVGADTYNQEAVSSLPIGRGLAKMAEKSKVRYNTVYYLAKNECLYSEFRDLLVLQGKNGVKMSDMYCNERAGANFVDAIGTSICQKLEDLEKCNYFTLLMDGSTDSSFTEQELIYVSFLDSKGTLSVKFLSIEDIKHAHADELKGTLKGLRQFLITESPLKMMKNAFYFTLKAPFVLKVFKFLSWHLKNLNWAYLWINTVKF